MKVFTCACVALVLASATFHPRACAQGLSETHSDSEVVGHLMYKWLHALKTRDVNALESIMADDFVTTNADGSVNSKEEEIAPFRSPGLQFDSISYQGLSITLFGTTAIVRGIGAFVGKASWGSFSSRERFTDVFLKRRGTWQAISSHSSAMRKK
jgi:hypothetical protein